MANAKEAAPAADETTVLDENDAALVVSADGEISFHMPDFGEDEEVPPLVAALGLLAIKLQDEGFVEDLLAELTDDDEEDGELDDEQLEDDEVDDDEVEKKPARS